MADAARLAATLADRYRIERELGAGGMATVYLAEDLRHGREVAIKVLHPELSAVLGPERFLAEIKLTASLQHPHILPLFDSGSADGLLYYVMPFVDGETLRERLERERQLPVADAVRIATEVADALEYAHKHGAIHRDIKPENVLLRDGHALVADFGIALAVQQAGGQRMTQTGMSLGTPQYMAPEQAMGDKSVDHRADIYALGAVTYEMLAGEAPFAGPTAQAIVARVMTEEPRALRTHRRSIPEHVEDAVLTALEKLPADRFGGAGEFAAALTGAGPRGSTRPDRADVRTPGARRNRTAGVAAALAIGALAGGAAGWFARSPAPAERLRVRFNLTSDSAQRLGSACCGPPIAISPDERRIVYVSTADGSPTLYVRALDDARPQPLQGTAGATEVFFSPDGEWIGYRALSATGGGGSGGEYELRKVPAGGGASVVIASGLSWPYGAAWTDDNIIVFAASPGGLFEVPAAGGTPVSIAGTDSAANPRYVRESRSILFSQWRGERHVIREMAMKSRRIRDLGEGEAPAYVPGGNLVSVAANGSLVAQPFDLESATATGPPQVLAADLSRAIDYAVSERGMLVYRSGTLSGTMSVADRAGVEKVLPFTVDGATHYDNPRYSPDGRRLVVSAGFSPGHKLVVLDLVTGTSLLMTFSGNSEFADWTPDGRSIVYVKDDSLVAEQPADRSAPERVLLSAGGNEIARVSVAGPWLAYAVRPRILTRGGPDARRSSNVFIVPRDGSGEPRAYQASGFGVYAPALSPGGERLAFVSDETGRPEVYIGSVPVAGGRQAVSPGGGREPVWSRDGRTLYYRTLARDLVAVDVGSGPGSAVTSRRTLFKGNAELSPDGSDFDVHPTNGSFLLLRSRTVDTELVVVTDAFGRPPKAP